MPRSDKDVLTSLAAARDGCREALGRLLERYRNYLLLIAGSELDPALRSKEGASDLVQQTFLEAQRDFAAFQGNSEEELLAWLRQLLLNNLANLVRRYRFTGKRQVNREVSLDSGGSSHRRRGRLPAPVRAPGEQAVAEEEARQVRAALARLPAEYRQVLLLRCRDNLPFGEIGRRMDRSTNAAQKLWARAVERLQDELGAEP